jgi:cytochrome P450
MCSARRYEFSAKTLKTFMFSTFVTHVTKSLDVLRSANLAEPFDVQELMARYTLESIGIIGFGVSLGAFSSSGASISSSFGDAFNSATGRTADRFIDPTWPIKRALGVGTEKELARSVKIVRDFATKVIEERREAVASGDADLKDLPDLLSRFMAKEKGSEEGGEFEFTNEELYYIIINFVLAGRDTTANSLTWTLWELAKGSNAGCVDRIREEAAALRKELGLGAGEITHDLIARSTYLKAVIQESLRLHPPVPVDIKECLADDVLPDGTEVRAGDRVMFRTLCECASAKRARSEREASAKRARSECEGGAFLRPSLPC